MPSHIFIRLGLWDEAVLSNANSVSSAQCYAQNSKMKEHWDEELHGLDYLLYAYLQEANDVKAAEQINYLKTIKEVSPVNFKVAYCFAAMPSRYAIERRDWAAAMRLTHEPVNFPWENFLWEGANINFARLLGAVHSHQLEEAKKELQQLESMHDRLVQANKNYEANFVLIQIDAARGWINLEEGNKKEAIAWMTEAANKEDATTKHPVTPGEILPARELLADMYLALNEPKKALVEYEEDLKRHPNRFNGLYGAGLAAEKSGDREKAKHYYQQLLTVSNSTDNARPEWQKAQSFVKN
jgi:tetratricopeptide (TPR) repeat protein